MRLGVYDANVLLLALQGYGLESQWWDERKREEEFVNLLEVDLAIADLLFNVHGKITIWGGHWVAVRPLSASRKRWALLDSKLVKPEIFDIEKLCSRLAIAHADPSDHVIVVRRTIRAPSEAIK